MRRPTLAEFFQLCQSLRLGKRPVARLESYVFLDRSLVAFRADVPVFYLRVGNGRDFAAGHFYFVFGQHKLVELRNGVFIVGQFFFARSGKVIAWALVISEDTIFFPYISSCILAYCCSKIRLISCISTG